MSLVGASRLASELRRDWEIHERQFDLPELLRRLDIRVSYERPRSGAEALSFVCGHEHLILVDPDLSPRRMRFTLGHELGHLLLEHGSASCQTADIHGRSAEPHEAEANAFCASLLLPASLFREDANAVHPKIEEISALATKYDVSLTSTAIRYAQYTRDACVVVGVAADGSTWITKSKRAGWWFELPPSEETLVGRCLRGETDAVREEVSARLWLGDFNWRENWLLTEEVIQTSPSTWLVLLSDLPDVEDDPDRVDRETDEELARRRNRFRRY